MTRMTRSFTLIAAIFCLSVSAGEITGKVTWEGKAPKMRPLNMDADPVCLGHHEDSPALSETLVLGEGNTIANIFVRVTKGLPDKQYDPPAEAAVLDQNGCVYVPHVIGVQTGQTLKVLNSDGILHNVNVQAKVNRGFNFGMPKVKKEAEKVFDKEEFFIELKCNVHPWMNAFLGVSSHPFFSVTGIDGMFKITGLPAGTYEITAWHEKAGTRTTTVTLGSESDAQSADFVFSRPKKK